MTDQIQASISSYEAGDCTRLAVYTDLLCLTPKMGVQGVLDALPSEWKQSFTEWLATTYDNDVPFEEFLSIGLPQEEPHVEPDPISLVRDWLRSRR